MSDLFRYALSAALSCIVLIVGIRHLDPNRAIEKKVAKHKKEIAKRLGRPLLQTNTYEDIIACDVVNPDHIDATFESIGGLDGVKKSLHELVILPLQRSDLFAHGKLLGPQKGVLLYGPPGTGKTLLAKAIAKEFGASFINVKISTLMSKWFGDAQKLVTTVFTLAYKLQPTIIFVDEVDSFLGQRRATEHEAVTNMKTEFMAWWDGFTTDQDARVMVLAATNRPWELDEAILRRLPRAFEVGMPNEKERAHILRVILKDENVDPDLDYDKLAALCDNYSGSDLKEICWQAVFFAVLTGSRRPWHWYHVQGSRESFFAAVAGAIGERGLQRQMKRGARTLKRRKGATRVRDFKSFLLVLFCFLSKKQGEGRDSIRMWVRAGEPQASLTARRGSS
ncbi:hypothetical protein KP509_08G058900 [Ceratopteris richardii]|uniref:AAA+ ATPase domain-containing protein n=1 Tax=Ceratopteris richardii TaxID=49495 RepID=A0A8T2U8E0_CERRI|nr:hypothetical protein KP509_08G058900 [Ceratopteris richardii]